MLSGPAVLLTFTLRSGLDEWLFVEEIKGSIKCVKLIWQYGLTCDEYTPAFVACDGPERLPHVFGVVGVEVSLPVSPDVSALLPWCQLSVSL